VDTCEVAIDALVLRVPRLHDEAATIKVSALLVSVGQRVTSGTPLCELRVDLAAGAALDCPPFFHSRLVSVEAGTVLEIGTRKGDLVQIGDALLLLVPDGATRPATSRSLRIQYYRVLAEPLDF
jgi:hypothetical protein